MTLIWLTAAVALLALGLHSRILYALGFTILGIFSIFISGFLVTEIEGVGLIPTTRTDPCWDNMELCSFPWFVTLWLYVVFLLPPAAYSITGWLTWKRNVKPLKVIAILLMATVFFFLAVRLTDHLTGNAIMREIIGG
jgi:hypothetical protein